VSHITVTLDEDKALLDALLERKVDLGHDCEGTLACASCRVIVVAGMERLAVASEDELDMLERASAFVPGARLACQVVGPGELVVEIPERAMPPSASGLAVTVTPRAARFLLAQLGKTRTAAVRLAVEPSGCSGFRHRVGPEDNPLQGDAVFKAGDLTLLVDAKSLPFVQGTTIDLEREGLALRLRFENPNATSHCGCGESFGT
jgi:iron-sulfur cluster assembly protein